MIKLQSWYIIFCFILTWRLSEKGEVQQKAWGCINFHAKLQEHTNSCNTCFNINFSIRYGFFVYEIEFPVIFDFKRLRKKYRWFFLLPFQLQIMREGNKMTPKSRSDGYCIQRVLDYLKVVYGERFWSAFNYLDFLTKLPRRILCLAIQQLLKILLSLLGSFQIWFSCPSPPPPPSSSLS